VKRIASLTIIGTGALMAASLVSSNVVARAPRSIAKPWSVPRTPDGKPDLQGSWSNATLTPLERLEKGQGLILTEEQAKKVEDRTRQVAEFRDMPSDPDRPAPAKGGEQRELPPGDPTFIERISQAAGGAVGGYNNFWLDPGERVLRIDGKPRASIVIDPPDGRVPSITAEAKQRMSQAAASRKKFGEFDHPELRGLAERCLTSFGSNLGPPMLPNYFYNNNYQIVQTKDHVMVMTEMVHDVRVIRLGTNLQHPPKDIRLWFGDSIGRWEGDTLVVETTNFHPLQQYRGASENLKVTERFTRNGPDTILYRFTIEDPTTFTAAWTGELVFNRFDEMIFEYACHEGNYALSNILQGERAKEKRQATQKQQ
jgi:hypothetical protein